LTSGLGLGAADQADGAGGRRLEEVERVGTAGANGHPAGAVQRHAVFLCGSVHALGRNEHCCNISHNSTTNKIVQLD
jgi:hypothetical protein